jgi:hypothetical protein
MSEQYVCRGCSWNCALLPNTEIPHLPTSCPFIGEELPQEIKPDWRRDCRTIIRGQQERP